MNSNAISLKQLKYRNKKVVIDGITFDSTAEGHYYGQLKMKKRGGVIKDFRRQVPYVFEFISLIGNYPYSIEYRADFVIEHWDGSEEVVDVKGMRTREYITKRKLMKMIFGIVITEIGKNGK